MRSGGESKPDKNLEVEPKALINTSDMLVGIYLCLNNSETFLKTSNQLLNNKNYQASIPIATISIEEAMKGLELVMKLDRNWGITVDDWDKLMNHKHKLTGVLQWALNTLENMNSADFDKVKNDMATETGVRYEDSLDAGKRNLQRTLAAYGHLQKLREMCFYSSWDKQNAKWLVFSELTEEKQEVLAFFVFMEAQIRFNILKKFIEKFVNKQRKQGQLLTKVPYPPYEDYKPPRDWESNALPTSPQSKAERVKYDRGFEVMKWFMSTHSFEFSASIFHKALIQCLRVIVQQGASELFPHPMIDAMVMAASAAYASNEEDQHVMALSGDANQTYSGNPAIVFAAIAKMNSNTCHFVEVETLAPNLKRKFTQDMVEKIIRTEIILERCGGKIVPVSICIEALSVIGIKCKMIKQNEIADAIRITKEAFRQGLVKCPEEMIRKIYAISGVEEWDCMGSELRSTVASTYGRKQYPGYEIYLTPSSNMPKFECRRLILYLLNNKYFPTA